MRDAIKINNISKSFGSKTVLDDINLDVEEGEIFGLLGPSGAGKTTPMFAATGSTTTAASRSPRSAKTRFTASASLYGTTIVCFA